MQLPIPYNLGGREPQRTELPADRRKWNRGGTWRILLGNKEENCKRIAGEKSQSETFGTTEQIKNPRQGNLKQHPIGHPGGTRRISNQRFKFSTAHASRPSPHLSRNSGTRTAAGLQGLRPEGCPRTLKTGLARMIRWSRRAAKPAAVGQMAPSEQSAGDQPTTALERRRRGRDGDSSHLCQNLRNPIQ